MLSDSDKAPNSDKKGEIFENLCVYLMSKINGITLFDKNVENEAKSEEIDLAFRNNINLSSIDILPPIFFAECKNQVSSMSSSQIRDFLSKLNNRKAKIGIVFSSKNISGSKTGKKHAASIVLDALKADGIITIVIDRKDILAFNNSDNLKNMIFDKYFNQYVYGTL